MLPPLQLVPPAVQTLTTDTGIIALATKALGQREWGQFTRLLVLQGITGAHVLALCSALFAKIPREESSRPHWLCRQSRPPPHLLRAQPDAQMRYAHCAAAAPQVLPQNTGWKMILGGQGWNVIRNSKVCLWAREHKRLEPPGTRACRSHSMVCLAGIWHV